MTYTLGAESVTRSTTFPEACVPAHDDDRADDQHVRDADDNHPPRGDHNHPSGRDDHDDAAAGQPFTFGAAATVCVA